MAQQFKITYATMDADPAALNSAFDAAVQQVEANRGKNFPMLIGGKRVEAAETFPVLSPMDTREPLFYFQKGTRDHAKQAIMAAKAAFPAWRAMPWQQRC